MVSDPDASWLPVLVFPDGHAVHTWFTTFSFGPHTVALAPHTDTTVFIHTHAHNYTQIDRRKHAH